MAIRSLQRPAGVAGGPSETLGQQRAAQQARLMSSQEGARYAVAKEKGKKDLKKQYEDKVLEDVGTGASIGGTVGTAGGTIAGLATTATAIGAAGGASAGAAIGGPFAAITALIGALVGAAAGAAAGAGGGTMVADEKKEEITEEKILAFSPEARRAKKEVLRAQAAAGLETELARSGGEAPGQGSLKRVRQGPRKSRSSRLHKPGGLIT